MRSQQPRLLVISHDVVGRQMAGPGIRAWELARVLSSQQPTTLIAPRLIDPPPAPFTVGTFTWGDQASLAPWLEQADVVFANGFALIACPGLADITQPLALDIYDPTLLENLESLRSRPIEQRNDQFSQDVHLLQAQLARGDFLICATERQRDLYLGGLMHGGQLTPTLTDHDPQLRGLLDVVPFGLTGEPPQKQTPALRGVIPGIERDDVVVLWTGGVWDWLDPLTLIRALPEVIAVEPRTKLVILAGQHPGAVQPMTMPQRTRDLAAELGLLDRHVFLYDRWIPYEQRADFLLEADIAVSLHRDHLETTYAAVRSRFLDHLWAGLPSLVSAGDAAAALVREHGLGEVVAAEDQAGLTQALGRLVSDPALRQRYADQARHLAARWRWADVAAPLSRFCLRPTRRRFPVPSFVQESHPLMTAHPELEHEQQALIHQLETAWDIARPTGQTGLLSRLIQPLIRRLVAPILARQQTFNANVVQLSYTLRTQQADMQGYLTAVLEQTLATQAALQATQHQLAAVAQQTEIADQRGRDAHERIDTIVAFENQANSDLHGRIDTLAAFDGQINDQIARLQTVVGQLNVAVAAADDTSAELAAQVSRLALTRTETPNG